MLGGNAVWLEALHCVRGKAVQFSVLGSIALQCAWFWFVVRLEVLECSVLGGIEVRLEALGCAWKYCILLGGSAVCSAVQCAVRLEALKCI